MGCGASKSGEGAVAATETGKSQPITSASPEQQQPEPAKQEPAKKEPAKQDPAKQEPAKQEPAKKEPAKPGVIQSPASPVTKALPKKSKFKNNGPSSEYIGTDSTETSMFDGSNVSQQLYLYVSGDRWYFYNDGRSVDMAIDYTFGSASKITACGNTTMESTTEGIACHLVVHPGATEPFIEGEVNGYSCSFETRELSGEYLLSQRAKNKVLVDEAIASVRAVAGGSKNPEDVLIKCLENNVQFVDLWFLPDDSSNFRDGIDEPLAPTLWQRPSEYLAPDWAGHVAVYRKISPDDIDQGALGDCYYLCSLASLAEDPSKVKDVFMHPKGDAKAKAERAVGAYRVTLNKGGWWVTYLLDNYFPTLGCEPYYAHGKEDPAELWVQLLEKAHAKAHGSYSAIIGGDPLQAMKDLTGCPTTRFDDAMKDKDLSITSKLLRWDSEGAMLSVSTPSASELSGGESSAENRYKKAGLALGHAYSVLKVVSFEDTVLLQIRNPWGNDVEWTGKWADSDGQWKKHPEVAKACQFNAEKDGTFWMEWSDVLKYFSSGGVCFTKKGWHDYRIKGHASDGTPNIAIEINVEQTVEAFVSVHQKDTKGQEAGTPDAEYASFMIGISRNEQGTQNLHMHATLDCEEPSPQPNFVTGRDLTMRYTFEPEYSPYVIIPRIYEKADKDFVVGLLTDVAVGSGIQISFVDLTPECPAYSNYLSFDLLDTVERREAQFQYNPDYGVPYTGTGSVITVPEE
eukprot:GILI01007496.1.p1 GENE.GILI01007496.1~~GILI01007496.1.p1  ORF type:complete len:741 (-),score=91.99 GILI01007496.1:64-2286(-)